jgi:hypothetical protein
MDPDPKLYGTLTCTCTVYNNDIKEIGKITYYFKSKIKFCFKRALKAVLYVPVPYEEKETT